MNNALPVELPVERMDVQPLLAVDMTEIYGLYSDDNPNMPMILFVEPEPQEPILLENNNRMILISGKLSSSELLLLLEKELEIAEGGCDVSVVSPKKYYEVYSAASDISRRLNINCPQIVFSEGDFFLPEERAKRVSFNDDNNNVIGETIYIKRSGRINMVYSCAHELRHCWQERQSGFYEHYFELTPNNLMSHVMQPEEVDAEAYASKYVEERYGLADGIKMGFKDQIDETDPQYRTIRNRKDCIVI